MTHLEPGMNEGLVNPPGRTKRLRPAVQSILVFGHESKDPSHDRCMGYEPSSWLEVTCKFNNLPRGVRCNLARRSTTHSRKSRASHDFDGRGIRRGVRLRRCGLWHLVVHSIHQSERHQRNGHHDIAQPIKMS